LPNSEMHFKVKSRHTNEDEGVVTYHVLTRVP